MKMTKTTTKTMSEELRLYWEIENADGLMPTARARVGLLRLTVREHRNSDKIAIWRAEIGIQSHVAGGAVMALWMDRWSNPETGSMKIVQAVVEAKAKYIVTSLIRSSLLDELMTSAEVAAIKPEDLPESMF